jgi:hypothetical protein
LNDLSDFEDLDYEGRYYDFESGGISFSCIFLAFADLRQTTFLIMKVILILRLT